MALSNANITTIAVKNVLSEDTNTVSLLCTSDAINKWSKWKPVSFNKNTGITAFDLYSINYGLTTLIGAATPQLAADNESIYLKPPGGKSSPYRMGDFRSYLHDSIPPVANYMGDVPVQVDIRNSIPIGVRCAPSSYSHIRID